MYSSLWKNLLLATMAGLVIPAPTQAKTNIKADGHIATGFDYEHRDNGGEFEADAVIQLETKRYHGLEGRAEATTNTRTHEVRSRDLYIDYKAGNGLSLRGGNQKKALGREYEVSSGKRLNIERSVLYQQLEDYGYVGREYQLQWRLKDKPHNFRVSLGLPASQEFSLNLSWQHQKKEAAFNLGVWLTLQQDRRQDESKPIIYAGVLSMWSSHSEGFNYTLELARGLDPVASEIEQDFGEGRDVAFAALKAEPSYTWVVDQEMQFFAFNSNSLFYQDTEVPHHQIHQHTLGGGYRIGSYQFRLYLDYTRENTRVDAKDWSDSRSGFNIEARVDL